MLNKNLNITVNIRLLLWFTIFVIILVTNKYYSIDELTSFKIHDAKEYFSISSSAPEISNNLSFHKAMRFFFPYLMGVISKISNLEIYIIYQISSFVLIMHSIYLLNSKFHKSNFKKNFLLISVIVFNPYFARYYISFPLMINDLIFIYGTVYLILFIKNKNIINLIISLLIICFARQESIFLVFSVLVCRLIFKKNSIFNNKKIILIILLTITVFSINYFYANNSTPLVESHSFSLKYRLGLFYFNYSFFDFIKFIIFFFIPLFLAVIILIYNFKDIKKNLIKNIKNEEIVLLLLFSFFIICPGILAGPEVSGKNIVRFSTLSSILLTYCLFELLQKPNYSCVFVTIYLTVIILFMQHPRNSMSPIFNSLYKFEYFYGL